MNSFEVVQNDAVAWYRLQTLFMLFESIFSLKIVQLISLLPLSQPVLRMAYKMKKSDKMFQNGHCLRCNGNKLKTKCNSTGDLN